MLPVEVLLSHLGPPILLLLQLLLSPTSAFFPNIWSLLAAPGSLTHQDLTEEAALNVTLQLFLEHPPSGRPRLRLEDYKVSIPGSSQILPFPVVSQDPGCQGRLTHLSPAHFSLPLCNTRILQPWESILSWMWGSCL